MIEIACSTACLPGIPLDEAADIIRQAGFDRVETAAGSSVPGLPASVFRASLEQLLPPPHHEHPLELPPAGILAVDTALGRKITLEPVIESLLAALDRAASCAPRLRLAMLNRCGSRVEQAADLLDVFHRLGNVPLQVAVDAAEFHRAAVNPLDLLRVWGDRLSVVRLADTAGGRPMPLGRGEINIPAVLGRLKTMRFGGIVVAAGIVPPGADAVAWLARELGMIRGHLD